VAVVAAAGIVQLPTAAVVVALPTIHAQFGTSLEELQWVVTAFYIPFSAFLILFGRLADIFGRRRLLITGCTVFAAGSAISALAPGTPALIAGIALAGIGGAMMMPSSMALLTAVFTGESRGPAIGMWGAATELVSGIGVLIGGVLTGLLSWRWIFWLDLAVAVVIAVLAVARAPESRDPKASRQVDVVGALLSVTALTCLTLALIQGTSWGWGSAAIVALFVAAAVAFAAFAMVERRSQQPIVDFSFFRKRNFTGAVSTVFVIDFAFGALLFFLPMYLSEILSYDAVMTGVLLLPLTVLMVVASPLGGRIAESTGPRPPIVVGLLMMAGSVLWISGMDTQTTYADLWLPTALLGFGIGIALTPMNLAAMNSVPQSHAGGAAALLVTLSGLGATLGVAVTGAVFNGLQIRQTVADVTAAGFPIDTATAEQLDGALAGSAAAQQTLQQVAGSDTAAVEEALREAFVDALGTSLKLSAVLILCGAVLAVLLLRRSATVEPGTAPGPVGSITPRPSRTAPDLPGPLPDADPGPERAPVGG
jgi:EmrB/QacA subfamily drug resistance transporter